MIFEAERAVAFGVKGLVFEFVAFVFGEFILLNEQNWLRGVEEHALASPVGRRGIDRSQMILAPLRSLLPFLAIGGLTLGLHVVVLFSRCLRWLRIGGANIHIRPIPRTLPSLARRL